MIFFMDGTDILVIGGGVSGRAAMRLAETLRRPARLVSDGDDEAKQLETVFSGVGSVVVSPGVTAASRLLQEALRRRLPVESELQFGARHFGGRILAVTGTNGKTTTVELTTHLLRACGAPARYAGNIGVPLSVLAAADLASGGAPDPERIAVTEVSSFQLEYTPELGAEAAVLLNLESDHLNRYPGGMAEYREVKERVFRGVAPENRLYGISMPEAAGNHARFAIRRDGLFRGRERMLDLNETALSAPHNRENLLGALELAVRGLRREPDLALLAGAIKNFHPGDHRIQLVAEAGGVRYIDDSKATNPAAVLAALRALSSVPQGNILLLAGGLDKDMDFAALADGAPWLRKAFLFGSCRERIRAALDGKVPLAVFVTLDEAFGAARAAAAPGNTVLLSPAAASMDQFRDYKERGEKFAALARSAGTTARKLAQELRRSDFFAKKTGK